MPSIKKTLIAALVVSWAFLAISCGNEDPWLAPLNPAFEEFTAQEAPLLLRATDEGHSFGYIPSPIPPEIHIPGQLQASEYRLLAGSPTDPKYDMRDPDDDGDDSDSLLTAVRNQGGCGACWAFATYGALESHVKETLAEVQDYSEDNLKHLAGFDWGPCDGGNLDMSTAYLSRYSGPISDADDPYDPSDSSDYCTDCDPVRYVDNVVWLPVRSSVTDNDYIKEALVQYGGLHTSYYHSNTYYHGSPNYTYYYSGSINTNHAVVIVGWDDDKEVSGAPDDGAFIVRNSWGSSWGDGGYFYVSYYDQKFAFSSLGYFDDQSESAISFDTVYYYDELGRTGSMGYGSKVAWGANWFVPGQDEDLTAVGFYATDTPTAYEIYIYEEFDGSSFSDPPQATKTGSVPHPGWYTVELDTPVELLEGDGFGVVIKFTNDDDNYPIPLERPVGGYASAVSANPGESYVSGSGSSWTDVTSYGGWEEYNVCIKAFCSDPVETIPLPAPEGYGRITGGDTTHPNEVNYGFAGRAGDVTILYGVYDVDFVDEVEILVNDVHLGYAAKTSNNAWSETLSIVIPDDMALDAVTNVLTFNNTRNPPEVFKWGVRGVSVSEGCLDCMPLPESGEYGRITGGDQIHPNEVNYSFDGLAGEMTILYAVYDVDFVDEVEILVNDVHLGYAAKTSNNAWSETLSIVIPDDMALDAATNVLTFNNTRNPPEVFKWGVRGVSVYEDCLNCMPLPESGEYGRITGGDQVHPNEVNYSFDGLAGDVTILYEVYDVDFVDEVEILVNDVHLGYAATTLNNAWSETLFFVIPDAMALDAATNVLTFNNTRNPPEIFKWGVRNVTLP